MFTQRKKRNFKPLIITILLIFILILIFVFFSRRNANSYQAENKDVYSPKVTASEDMDNDNSETDNNKEKNKDKETYYLVKSDNNSIVIYFSDKNGDLTKLEDTTIIYDMLTVKDQERFNKGIKVTSREQLNELIMNYES